MSSSSFPIYTITNTQCIRIYPGKLKLILVKISPHPGRLHGKHAKENQTLLTFITTENLSGLPCSHECKYGAYSDLSSYAVNLPELMHLDLDINGWGVSGYLIFIHFFCVLIFIRIDPNLRIASKRTTYGQIFTRFAIYQSKFA